MKLEEIRKLSRYDIAFIGASCIALAALVAAVQLAPTATGILAVVGTIPALFAGAKAAPHRSYLWTVPLLGMALVLLGIVAGAVV